MSVVPGFEDWDQLSCLLDCRLVAFPRRKGALSKISGKKSMKLYKEMGACRSGASYIATWLHWEDSSIVMLSEVTNASRWQTILRDGDFPHKRFQSVCNPVMIALPSFLKNHQEPQSLSNFFGEPNLHFEQISTASGAEISCLQIDLSSKWLMRMAVRVVPLRSGSSADFLLLDEPSRTVFVAGQFEVTEEVKRQLGLKSSF